jgi:elongation factor 1 alpha-like protein
MPLPAGKKTPAAAKATKKGSKDKDSAQEPDLTSSVSSLKVSDIPPPKSKGLDVVKEFENSDSKRSASFVVVGRLLSHNGISKPRC